MSSISIFHMSFFLLVLLLFSLVHVALIFTSSYLTVIYIIILLQFAYLGLCQDDLNQVLKSYFITT